MRMEAYVEACSTPPSSLLQEIQREAELTKVHPRMVSGHMQGELLTLLTHMIQPRHALELGTYVGYATICIATALPPEGRLTTLEMNDELEPTIRANLQRARVADRVELQIGDATKLIPELPIEEMQLLYLDANKAAYPEYYRLLVPRMGAGSYMIADNTLWNGKLLDTTQQDPQTAGIRLFNKLIAEDTSLQKVLLPLRDGLTIIRKRGENEVLSMHS